MSKLTQMRFFSVILCFVLTVIGFAQGGPPMLTDDPGTPPEGHWEFNLAYTIARSHTETETGLPLADLNYGARQNVQIKIEMPWLLVRERGTSIRGLGPVLAGVKWRFQEETKGSPAVSTFPQVEFPSSRQSVNEGLSEPGTGLLLPIEAQWHRGKWSYNLDGGVFVRPGEAASWLGGAAIAFETHEGEEFIFETHEEGTPNDRALNSVVQLGYRRDLGPSATLLLAIGRSIFTQVVEPTRMTGYLGVQFRY